MRKKHSSVFQDFLSRETGGQRKKWKGRLPVALVFPNEYRAGMSSLGFQIVFDLVNSDPDIVCERFFLSSPRGQPRSVESNRPLRDFPVILFSVSFEHDYLNLVRIICLARIPPLAADRSARDPFVSPANPLIICGGVATFINPEPLAPFIDMFVLGEAEPVLPAVLKHLKERLGKDDRDLLLRSIASGLAGCYAPHFYEISYRNDGLPVSISAPQDLPQRVIVVRQAEAVTAGHSRILTPDAEFADLFLTELGRGCGRGCRFCAAGYVYRPPRLWSMDAIVAALSKRPKGATRVGLIGMEMAPADELASLARYMLRESCSLSFSSLRADAVTPSLLDLFKKSGVKSVAIAPDGSSERMRGVINKGITRHDVLQAAQSLIQTGVMNLKLYFMIGLPTETRADLDELVELTLRIKADLVKAGRPKGRLAGITLSINCFVPKAWTPFQYHGFEGVSELKKRLTYIRRELSGQSNITVKAESPGMAFFQAVLARGDRKVGITLLEMVRTGRNWQKVMRSHGLHPEFYAMRGREENEIFPWEIIDNGINREYLFSEYRKSLQGRPTSACDTARCRRCGVCNDGS